MTNIYLEDCAVFHHISSAHHILKTDYLQLYFVQWDTWGKKTLCIVCVSVSVPVCVHLAWETRGM